MQALQRLAQTLGGDVRKLFALIDGLEQAVQFPTDAAVQNYIRIVLDYYAGINPAQEPRKLECSRRHPYTTRTVRDLHQRIFAGGDCGHQALNIAAQNGINLRRFAHCLHVGM